MSSPSSAGNPLTDLPITGDLIGLVDRYLQDVGFSAWGAETFEFVVSIVLLFALLSIGFGKLIPRVSSRLLDSADRLTSVVPAVLLAPEWLVTESLGKFGRSPGRMVYIYGDVVYALTDGIRALLVALLKLIGMSGKIPHLVAGAFIILGMLTWNNESCVGDARPCVSPAQQWVKQAPHQAETRQG